MRLMRYITSLLLAATLLVTGAAVDAKKPDEDKSDKSEKWQRQERREAQENGRRDRYDERQRDGRQYEERRYEEPRYREPRYAEPRMSLSDAVAEAERRTGGQALSAEPRLDNGRTSYRVKVLTPNGRVQVLYFDAN